VQVLGTTAKQEPRVASKLLEKDRQRGRVAERQRNRETEGNAWRERERGGEVVVVRL
jgi:hypothetical protein